MSQLEADLRAWLSGSLFADAGGVQGGGAGREVGEHLPRHRVERFLGGAGFEYLANVFEACLVASRERDHEGSQDLLYDGKDLTTFLVHMLSHGAAK